MVTHSNFPPSTQYPLVTQPAGSSRNRKGSVVAQGSSKLRLQIGNDARFWVAVKREEEFSTGFSSSLEKAHGFVKVTFNDNSTVFLNMNSLSSRLHLKKKAIKQMAENGQFWNDLFSKQPQRISLAIEQYEKFIQGNYHGISSSKLMKIFYATTELLSSSDRYPGKIVRIENKEFMAYLSRKKNFKIYAIKKHLGEGSLGVAHTVEAIHKKQTWVLKRSLTSADIRQQAVANIQNEFEILEKIHGRWKVLGIQEKPKVVISMKHQGEIALGYIGKKYDSDYLNDIYFRTPFGDFNHYFEIYQLLYALKYLEEIGIVHGDVKRENIFVENVKGRNWLFLGDFGDSKDTNQASSIEDVIPSTISAENPLNEDFNHIIPSTITSQTVSYHDLEIRARLADGKDMPKLVKHMQKFDVFGMGMAIYEMITNRSPFEVKRMMYWGIERNFPDVSTYTADYLRQAGVPGQIQTLIKQMLHHDPEKRCSASQAFESYDNFLEQYHSDVQNKIKQLVANR